MYYILLKYKQMYVSLKTFFINIILFAGGDDVQQLCEAGEEEFLGKK